MRRAMVLALHTGRRSSDLIRMRWDDYDDSAIQVTQEKTGSRLWVPCHADLKVELTEWKRNATSVTILINPASGQPWNRIGFPNALCLAIKAHPEVKGYVFHGLRKSSASLPAQTGCSALEIAAITGHMSLKNREIYTRRVDRRQRANAAIAKLKDHRRETQKIWAGNPLETFIYCRLKQKLTWASPACCGTPLSELPMVRRPLRKKRRPFRQ
ncbi:tyrosine-type recombinase/integrase [Azospirillum sp. TSA2s]|uniref:tyrosine-type recombinase/integrase n=1 Tax=Azospirillum sp. TSA2s TaxID=709810 RepID=UPI0035282672